MPSGTLPANGYLGDGQRTTGEFQGGIDELLAYVNTLKAEVDALTSTVIREAATRSVGGAAGNVPDTAQLDTRLGTSGNLGDAAQKTVGTATGNLVELTTEDVAITDVSTNASFTLNCRKLGDAVLISSIRITHDSASEIISDQQIPAAYRPTTHTRANVYYTGESRVRVIRVDIDGTVRLRYFDMGGVSSNSTDSGSGVSISYVV